MHHTDCSFETRLRKEAEPKALVIGPNGHNLIQSAKDEHLTTAVLMSTPSYSEAQKWQILSQIMSGLRDLSRNTVEKSSMM